MSLKPMKRAFLLESCLNQQTSIVKEAPLGLKSVRLSPRLTPATKAETSPSCTDINCVYVVNERLAGFIHSHRFEMDEHGNSFLEAKTV